MSLDRRVAEQDQAQTDELTSRAKEKRYREEVKENERQNAEIDKQNAEAEAKYQKELAEYNKNLNQQNTKLQSQELQGKYDAQVQALRDEKARAMSEVPTTDSDGRRLTRSALADKQNRIGKDYDQRINQVKGDAKTVVDNALFSEAYPGRVMTQRDRKVIAGRSVGTSAVSVIQQKDEKKQASVSAQSNYQISTMLTNVQSSQAKYGGYTSQQADLIKKGNTGLRGELRNNPEAARRAAAIKPTPNIITGKQADTRPRMINVNTGQSIMGGRAYSPSVSSNKIETYRETPTGPVLVRNVIRITPEIKASKGVPQGANPRAYVAGLDRQNVGADGKPIKEKQDKKISNIDILKQAAERYQYVYGTKQKAPYASVLEASLTDRGRKVGVMDRLFISQSSYKQYSTRAEAVGLKEAKGKKATYKTKDGGEFSLETGLGGTSKADIQLGTSLGFDVKDIDVISKFASGYKSTTPIPAGLLTEIVKESGARKTILGTSLLGEYTKYEKPRTDPFQPISSKTPSRTSTYTLFKGTKQERKFNTKTLEGDQKIAESVGFVFKTEKEFEKKESFSHLNSVTSPALTVQEPAPQKSPLNNWIETRYDEIGKMTEYNAKNILKNPSLENKFVQITYAPNELGRVGLGIAGSLLNLTEEAEQFIGQTTKLPNLKISSTGVSFGPREITPPVELKAISGDTSTLPYDFDKGKFDQGVPFFNKEYSSRQAEYIKKYGVPSLVVGGATNLLGVGALISSTGRIGLRTVSFLKTPGKQAVKNELVIAANTNKGAIFRNWDVKQKGGIKTWDQLQKGEKGEKIGNRQPAGQPKLEPNPFGKQYKIPYAINQAKEKIQGGFQTIQTEGKKAVQTVKTKTSQITTGIRQKIQVNSFLNPNKTLITGRNVFIPNITGPQRNFSKLNGLGITINQKVKPFIKTMGTVFYPDQPVTTKVNKYGRASKTKDNLSISLYKTKQSIKDTWSRMGAVYDTTGTIKPVVKKTKKKPNILSKAQADFNANLNKQKKKVGIFITKRKDILDDKLSTVKNKLDVKQKLKNIKTQKQLADYFAEQDRAKNLDVKKAKTGPEIITPLSTNYLANVGRSMKGVTGPISDFFSKVKPFQQKLNLKGLYTTNQGSIGRIQGKTSRGAFADLLNEGINRVSPIQKFFRQSFKPNKSFGMVSQNKQKIKLFEDLKKIQKKGDKFTQTQKKERFSAISSKPDLGVSKTTTGSFGGLYFRRKEFFKQDIFGDLLGKSRRTERLRENVFEMGKQGKLVISNFVKRGKVLGVKADLPVSKFPSSQDVKTQNMLKDIGKTNREGLDFVASQKKSFDARKSSFTSPDTNLEILKSEINKLDLKQGGIKRLQRETRNLIRQGKLKLNWRNKINLPDNMTKMQYKNEGLYKALESESTGKNPIIEGLKTEKSPSTRIIWRLNEADTAEAKFTRSRLKDNEKYRAIGITVGAGTLGLVATSQTQEAQAMPFPQILAKSGRQILVQETRKSEFPTIPISWTKSVLGKPKTITKSETKSEFEPKYKIKKMEKLGTMSIIIPKIIQSQPQKIQQTVRLTTITPQRLQTNVKQETKQKQQTKQKIVQAQRYGQIFQVKQVQRLVQKQSLKLSAPLAPKQPQKLSSPQKIKPIEKIKLITRLREPPKNPRRMFIPFALPKEEKKRETPKSKAGEKADFLGNVPESSVVGVFGRSEITYGLRKIAKLSRGDRRVERGGSRSVRRGTAKFVEGKGKDPFGFKDNTKKGKKFRISF